jgi:hypothetical protein
MKSAVFPMAPAARRSRQSMALILTLAILALLSILLVAFVSTAALDRGATASYSQALPADQIALGGLDQIVSQFQSEIADPSLSTNSYVVVSGVTNNLYVPLANAVPQRTAPAAANLATLLSYSGVKLYTVGAGASDYSSSSLTQTPSVNGRSVSTANWNKPQLTTGTTTFPTPKWILMTRCGPTNGNSLPFGATTANSLANNSALNANYVVGRYAYVVYDTSGLLDANVAGYPSTASSSANGKGLVPWADLTQLTGSITQPDVDNLINFRNATTVNGYATNVANAATTNGFTRVANGDTTFLGRQDLIKYATTQNPDLVNALPYLTTFSREANGPTWGPTVNGTGASYQYASSQYTFGSFNPRIPNPRVPAGSGFVRDNGLQAVPGEPLVKYRFPLDKLALLEKYMGTGNGSLTASDITSIQQYFGLDLGTNSTGAIDGNGPSYRHWTYPTASSTYKHGIGSGTTGIMSLDDVAAQNREPDFFELLQAGMLSGSLGAPGNGNKGRSDQLPANANGYAGFIDPDDKATLQILRTGANIIDQWDADSFPTTITYLNPGGTGYINLEGIEDLPYPAAAYLNFYSPNSGTTGGQASPMNPFEFFLYFELWNPHQMPASPVATSYPTGFRFCPYYNNAYPATSDSFVAGFNNSRVTNSTGSFVSASWFYYGPSNNNTKNGVANGHSPFYLTNLAPSGIPFAYSPTSATTGYREPTLAVPGTPAVTGPAPWNTIACLSLPALTNFPPLNAASNQGTSVSFPGATVPPSAWQCQYYFHMVMPVQYQDAANNWHTYSTFLGMDDPGGAFFPGTGYIVPGFTTVNYPTASLSCQMLMKSDPRTFRFGTSSGSASPDYNVPLAYLLAGASTMTVPVSNGTAPFGASAPYALDMWAANDSTTSSKYSDVDGILRWGDARNSIRASTTTSPLFTGATANRPVILNRPFQSVGELGYVYRDMPWKTLDLYSASSADSALLDLFTLSEAPLLAGRVNPNTPYPQVLAALISGATQGSSGTTVSAANALTIGTAMTSTSTITPFASRADIVNNFMTNSAITGMSTIKTEEEAAVRAIAESSNTRTWNFLIDIVAQSGRYPSTATSLDNFVVEGQRHYWLHIAIDRYTGKVVDKQLEVVNE